MPHSLDSDCAHLSLVEVVALDGSALIRCTDCGATLRVWLAATSPAEHSDTSSRR